MLSFLITFSNIMKLEKKVYREGKNGKKQQNY